MRSLFSIAAALLASALCLPAHAAPFQYIVAYGDSLSDSGNVYAATHAQFPPFPYVNGHFTNGTTAIEQLAASLNVQLMDFAFGGATTGTGNVLNGTYGLSGLPGMATEAQVFQVPSAVLANALTFVWGGANDFSALSNPTVADAVTAAGTAAGNISNIVAGLQKQGANNILVPSLPNLGLTPRFYGSTTASAYTTTFNAALANGLPSGVKLFDTNAVFNAIIADPAGYGLSQSKLATPCLYALAFPSCTGYLFFDDIHPTTAVDSILARDFAAAVAPTPEPSSLLLLGTGLVSAVGMLRRRSTAVAQESTDSDA